MIKRLVQIIRKYSGCNHEEKLNSYYENITDDRETSIRYEYTHGGAYCPSCSGLVKERRKRKLGIFPYD